MICMHSGIHVSPQRSSAGRVFIPLSAMYLYHRQKTRRHDSSVGMQTVSELIAAEVEIKTQLKRKRAEIKAAIEDSEMYRTILDNTMHPIEGPEVPLKVAKTHAFKVAKSALTGEGGADEGSSDE